MKRIVLPGIIVAVLLSSCRKEERTGLTGFADNFSGYSTGADLFNQTNWTYFEQTYAENTVSISRDTFHSDSSAIRFYAVAGDGRTASKADLASHGKVAFFENETVRTSCWVYIPGQQSIDKVLLLDLEDPAAISTGPGIRLMFDPDNALFVERNKMTLSNLTQPAATKKPFPLNQWVHVEFELKLSTRKRGYVKLWQNNELLLDETNIITMPRDRLYYTQGTHKSYANVEFGITANGSGIPQTMFVDDFSIQLVQ